MAGRISDESPKRPSFSPPQFIRLRKKLHMQRLGVRAVGLEDGFHQRREVAVASLGGRSLEEVSDGVHSMELSI
jgi:hypothetical protein